MNKNFRTFWDYIGSSGLYQMGPSSYRTYILDRLTELGVKTILEEGCGTGPIYQLITETIIDDIDKNGHNDPYPRWDFYYKGTDFAKEMVKTAKRHFPQGNFEQQDARHPKEVSISWDAVLLIDTLDHLDDYKSAIKEAARIAKKYVVISLWRNFVSEGTNLNNKNMMNKEEGEKPWADTHLQEYSKTVLMDEFIKNGLSVLEFVDTGVNKDWVGGRSLYILQK